MPPGSLLQSRTLTQPVPVGALLTGVPNGVPTLDAAGILTATQAPAKRQTGLLGVKGVIANASTITGLGCPIGAVPAGTNQITVYLAGPSAGTQPTGFRAVVRSVNSSGAIVGEAYTPASGLAVYPASSAVVFNFGSLPAGNLWLEIYSDVGYAYVPASVVIYAPAGYPMALYTTSVNANVVTSYGGGSFNFYCEFGYEPSVVNVQIPYSPAAGFGSLYDYETGTFNGWSRSIGSPQNFNRVEFEIRQWSQQPITRVRVRILDGSQTGVPLTDQTITVATKRGVQQTVTVDLPQIIANSAGDTLYLEWRCDGYCGSRKVAGTVASYYFATTLDITASTVPSADTGNFGAYIRLSRVDQVRQPVPNGTSPTVAALVAAAQQPWLNLRSSLPATVYGVTGRENNIYFANFLRSDVPLSQYSYVVTCTKGENDANRWFYKPVDADAGNVTWSVAVYWGAVLVNTFSTTITFVAAASGTGVTRKMLVIGDSLTQFGYWLAELKKLYTGDPMTLTIVGSLSTTVADSAGTSQTVAHDAVSGKDINYFATNAASPFVFAGSFNFATFLTTVSITMAANDTVRIMLGTNDVFGQTTDAAVALQVRTMLTQLATMITSIKAAVAGVRIVLDMTIPPAASQDAFGVSYGTGQTRDRFARNVALWREALVQAYDGGAVAGVSLCATHLNLDTVNGFPTTSTAFADRITTTYSKQSNGVHPTPVGASGGMWQMADTIFAHMKATA